MNGLVVVKYGSETVADAPGVNLVRLDAHVQRLVKLPNGLIVVSSGSVMAGKAEAPYIEDEQILAGLGSANIVMGWKKAFAKFSILASQVAVTDYEIEDPTEGGILREALLNDIQARIVPIVNTNDKLSHAELEKRRWNGENDGLAADIGILTRAEAVFFMTNAVDGLMYEGSTITEIPYNPVAHERALGLVDDSNAVGKGGMKSKIGAMFQVAGLGIDAYLAQADSSFEDIVSGKTGTHVAKRA